jgi:hypothetical protein
MMVLLDVKEGQGRREEGELPSHEGILLDPTQQPCAML